MVKSNIKKVCIVVSSLGGGGAERSSALLSEMLDDMGYDVHIVSVLNNINYPFKGELLNLGLLKSKNDSVFGRLKRLLVFKKYLRTHKFDYIIDNRTRIGFFKEFIISKLIYGYAKVVYCVHSFKTRNYVHPNKFLGRLLYGSTYRIVCVSNMISDKLKANYGFKNLETVYNSITINSSEKLKSSNQNNGDYILFFGRIEDSIKNLTLLIDAYQMSKLAEANIKLILLGDGKDKQTLQQKVELLNLNDHVLFFDYMEEPFQLVHNALFSVLTSKYEGFPMSLVESLYLGIPVVSVNCNSGPSEIIINETNGLLVENNDPVAFAKALNRMIEDKKLYLNCKSNATSSVEKFSMEKIGSQWKSILN